MSDNSKMRKIIESTVLIMPDVMDAVMNATLRPDKVRVHF